MINLLAISYENIWPYQKKLTICFRKGKFLVKAPIGSWKSFLFFDGPVYGLYKYSPRNMVNIKSKQGSIKLLFSLGEKVFLVTRIIEKKVSKEWCTSRFFEVKHTGKSPEIVSATLLKHCPEIINLDADIWTILWQEPEIQLLEEVFKNEKDLQAYLGEILPPREIFLSTHFLMQDATNIFELMPSERIDIFKNVFGLLSIDIYKETIADKKREISTEIKVRSDTKAADQELRNIIQSIISSYDTFQDLNWKDSVLGSYEWQISDLRQFGEELRIEWLRDDFFPPDVLEKQNLFFSEQKESYTSLSTRISHLNESLLKTQNSLQTTTIAITGLEKSQETLKKEISQNSQELLSQLKKEKAIFTENFSSLVKDIDFQYFQKNNYPVTDIFEAHSTVQQLIEKGKTLAQQVEWLGKQKNLIGETTDTLKKQLQERNWENGGSKAHQEFLVFRSRFLTTLDKEKNLLLNQKNILENQQEDLQIQLKKSQETLNNLKEHLKLQSEFFCSKIDWHCPFMEKINEKTIESTKKHLEDAEKQFYELQEKHKTLALDKKIAEIEITLNKHEKSLIELENNPRQVLSDFFVFFEKEKAELVEKIEKHGKQKDLSDIEKEIQQLEEEKQQIKLFLEKIDWKKIWEIYKAYREVDINLKELDKKILEEEARQYQFEEKKNQLIASEQELVSLGRTRDDLVVDISKLEETISSLKKDIVNFDITKIDQLYKLFRVLSQSIADFTNLIWKHKKNSLLVQDLHHKETLYQNLYQIFSKELLLVVLQDSLPTLSAIINNYLAQVVDFSLDFVIIKKAGDKLELECIVSDLKGKREVKALSGGQKVILKLVWILSIASYLGNEMLFLDETINNLDAHTIGSVAEMLQNFVKQRNITLYTVTHSPHIQEMDIWDETIDFSALLN